MKIKSGIVYLAFIFCCQLYGQNSDLKRLSLNGNVKIIRERSYQAVEKDGKVEKGELEFSYYNSFNKEGNKVDDIRYTPEGTPDKKYVYSYDTLGRRTEQDQFNSDEILLRKIIYKYDENGNLTEDNSFNAEGLLEKKYTYKHDNHGNIIEDNSFGPDNVLLKKYTYKYDEAGNRVENCRYSERCGTQSSRRSSGHGAEF